ncbi:sigma-70 family RNA polymerase sigma factor [Cohnella kolymensis]|uniref:Sigma-70 family RNA polymerase sigma factor n=2 Tax=Cohnella kolymensis TaxID=1590652 RepID=A0ABR5A6L4_9BACL|nr:sigma-70 family RNA polymerase sigma factor [Cohnella kolymensis]
MLRNPHFPETFCTEEQLLEELYRQMLKVVRHKLWHKPDAGDVVQEAWVRILENRSSLREQDKLIPWAKTIAANLAYNANRARSKEVICETCENEYNIHGAMSEPELMLELSDLLGCLDPTTRTLLLYKFYYGLKDREIADTLGVPVGTVKARIHRSKARLNAQVHDDSPRT